MNQRRAAKPLALLTALALALTLLAGCGGKQSDAPQQPSEPAPAQQDNAANAPAPTQTEDTAAPETKPEEAEDPQPEAPPAEASDPTAPQPEEDPAEADQPTDPEPEAPSEPAAVEPETDPAPEPEPEGENTESENIMADGAYTISVTLEGGSGRATVESPATLRCKDGTCWATIVWSSPNFDYMKVDGQRYDPINTEGNSTFEIPVSAFDQPLAVIADTVAMSEPHEVEYTLTFDSASMQDA